MARVFVKNTFLDLEDGPRMAVLERSRTAPVESADPDMSEEEDEEVQPTICETVEEGDEDEYEYNGVAPPPPMPTELYRMATVDGYEPTDQWSWVGGDPNNPGVGCSVGEIFQDEPVPEPTYSQPVAVSPSPSMVPTTSNPAPTMSTPAPPSFGVVMVPMSMGVMAQQVVQPMPMEPTMTVPVERFTRWPETPAPPATAAPELTRIVSPGMPPLSLPSIPGASQSLDVPRAPVLERAFSVASQVYRVRWTVEARKLKSSDREAVSPPFELSFSRPVQFKMVIRPKAMHDQRGGASFKKAKGKGSVEMRCLEKVEVSANPTVTFRIAIGSGIAPGEPPRGPVRHDFSDRAICGLPEDLKEWDFQRHVDPETATFVVCLEILSGPAADKVVATAV